MPTARELTASFWAALRSDRVMMLGLDGVEDAHARPMTAHVTGDHGPIWFFTANDNGLVERLAQSDSAFATFAAKGHDLFATVHGTLSVDSDRAQIDKLWNPFVAAWYEKGKDDPKLVLLRFEVDRAEIWRDASSMLAGVMMLLGVDPKKKYKDDMAKVSLK